MCCDEKTAPYVNVGRDSVVGVVTLRARGSMVCSPVGARFSGPIKPGHEAHPASSTMPIGLVPGVKRLGLALTTNPLQAPGSSRGRAILLPPLHPCLACYGTALPLSCVNTSFSVVIAQSLWPVAKQNELLKSESGSVLDSLDRVSVHRKVLFIVFDISYPLNWTRESK